MQPYLFPYLGYFQLIAAVDRFVVYDDVSFIKNGWINRNRILGGGAAGREPEPAYFTVPLEGASSFKAIREVGVSPDPRWRAKLLKTLAQTYARAPCFREVYPLVESVLGATEARVSALAVASLRAVAAYLALEAEFVPSSAAYENGELRGQERVLDICRREGATTYVNPSGGRELYARDAFAARGVTLRFLEPQLRAYPQLRPPFVPGLSIIDVLMFNPRDRVRELLDDYRLV